MPPGGALEDENVGGPSSTRPERQTKTIGLAEFGPPKTPFSEEYRMTSSSSPPWMYAIPSLNGPRGCLSSGLDGPLDKGTTPWQLTLPFPLLRGNFRPERTSLQRLKTGANLPDSSLTSLNQCDLSFDKRLNANADKSLSQRHVCVD